MYIFTILSLVILLLGLPSNFIGSGVKSSVYPVLVSDFRFCCYIVLFAGSLSVSVKRSSNASGF